ncbi:hypothetical protein [Morganella psychrotolerans]|uniref:hypothetical protein n=1 Tax=Morganella psychrotolerans TaxID=368603 RepID=UPI0039AF2DE9
MHLFFSVLLIVIIALAPAALTGGLGAEYNVKIAVMGALLLLANMYLYRYRWGKVLVGVLTLLWGLNLSASAFFRREAGSQYIADLPALLSQEYTLPAGDALAGNIGITSFFIIVSVAYFGVVHLLSSVFPRRVIRNAGLSLLLLSFILPVEYYAMEKDKTPGLTVYDHYLLGTPLYNLSSVSMARRCNA